MQRRELLLAGAGAAAGLGSVAARGETVSDTEVVLGQSAVLSGPLGVPIRALVAGATLAFDAANAQGGVAGRKVRLVSLDDELQPDKAVANYQALLDQHKAFAFFACVGSGTTAAASKVLKAAGASMVGGFAVADSAREKTLGSAFYLRAGTAREAQVLVQQLTTIGITRFAMAHMDNPGGQETLRQVEAALEAKQLKATGAVAVKGDGSNAADQGRALAAQQPQAVIMYLSGKQPADLMQGFWSAGGNAMFYGMSIVSGEATAKVLGDKARGLAIAQVMPYPWDKVEPTLVAYQQQAQAAKVDVGYYSVEGYLNAQVMLEALRRCGRELTRPKLQSVLQVLKMRLAGLDVDFTGNALSGSRFVELVQVRYDGKFMR